MAGQGNKTVTAYRITNVCIILTLGYSILSIAVFLRTKGAVCSTTSSGVNLSIAFSLPTIMIMGVRCYLMFQQRSKALQTISPSTASPRLESACTTCVQVLVILWMILGCVNLLVALRAPTCLREPLEAWQNELQEQNWRYGLSCRLHRALVALSVLMAIFMACLSFLDQQHPSSCRGAGVLNCYCTCLSRKAPSKVHTPALSVSSSRSGVSVEKNDHLFLVPERRPNRIEHEQWLQRRNSLSSQKAIYPHKYYYCHDHRNRYHYQPYTFSQQSSSRYSSTLRSVSEGRCLDLGDRNSSLCSSQSSSTSVGISRPSTQTRPSTVCSRSRANSNPERGDLRRTISANDNTPAAVVSDVPPLPTAPAPTWSPALHHTPLSADPTIRALSTGSALTLQSLLYSKVSVSPDSQIVAQAGGNINTAFTAGPPTAKREAAESSSSSSSSSSGPSVTSTKLVKKTTTTTEQAISPRKQVPTPMPSVPPPPVPLPTQPPAARRAAAAAPAIPARAPGHHHSTTPGGPTATATSRPTTRSRSASASASTAPAPVRANLRRPSPIRYRHYHHHHQYAHGMGSSHSQTQPPLPLPLQQYQHQRIWRRENSTNPSSIYSASSYGTGSERTTSVLTTSRGSTSTSTTTAAPHASRRPDTAGATRQ
ncbi:uncharacterized protein Z520_03436 [Fonsecaea multimorphosa CBS 102226]|uniref:Uncharacterized protein n=1 Tax=Fonsecaea multimorphosa CBS 102226 TaxID=1442371 RepID=A0A0D2HFS8_9EURO|nr:uncharacterized protein Z520_03436 [Fonsecaea multimorphosa CBS 102226]KIY00771.1 hypothetical protein Z520_03436 [Fonsecaea multimorphosa CBS 102226]